MIRVNERGITKTVFDGEHLRLEALKRKPNLRRKEYLHDPVPLLPIPVEFQIHKVIHVTGESGMRGILDALGFRVRENAQGENQFLCWSLAVDDADHPSAQHRFLKALLPNMTPEEVKNHPEFLRQFTTSAALQQESCYGNFKFTFPLNELLQKYSKQFCAGKSPKLKVYKTEVYKQEIAHVVLIHSPDVNDPKWKAGDVLPDNEDGPLALRDGSLLWRPQAISDIYDRKVVTNEDGRSVRVDVLDRKHFFMWEHGVLAFHIPPGKMLCFEREELLDSLSACEISDRPFLGKETMDYKEAERIVAELKKNR